MVEDPNEHPAYCQLCDAPNYNGWALCDACNLALVDDDDTDNWAGMNELERVEFVVMNLRNGNLTDAINFIMHDGDVRADSVKLAIDVMAHLILVDGRTAFAVRDQLIRLIETWETQ